MSAPDPALAALARSLARLSAAEAIEEECRNPPDRTCGVPIEIGAAHRKRRSGSDEEALRRAVEAAMAAGVPPIRAELFADGRILLFFDGDGPPGAVEGWREVLAGIGTMRPEGE